MPYQWQSEEWEKFFFVYLYLFFRSRHLHIYEVIEPIKTSMMLVSILKRGLRNKALMYASLVVPDFLNRDRKG